ncbi:MAG: hypothetical protein R6U36_03145 [Candidatus Fermentibacteraceae bacterium]
MKTVAVLMFAAALLGPAAGSEPPLSPNDLAQLSREMTGLLDGYLEAVPECPPEEDTPVRLWRLDSAWLRADAVFGAVSDTASAPQGVEPAAWGEYTESCRSLLDAYGELVRTYHGDLPDSARAVRLEDGFLSACSLYALRETAVMDLLEEEVRI